MKRLFSPVFLLFFFVTMIGGFAQEVKDPRRTLDFYYVDVEGGAATLIVTPAGESILIDAGWPGFAGRDARRIQKAMAQARLTTIDHLIITHYHTDHYGGVPELARLVRVRKFYDHGAMSQLQEDRDFAVKYAAYQKASKGKSITLKPGAVIQLKTARGMPDIKLRCLAARGEVIAGAGQGSNAECATAQLKEEDKSDNARSVVLQLQYGDFDFLDTGDLTWNIEHKLVCPNNLIGRIDLYQVAHHGANSSNNPALLRSIEPTVAIMNNGPRKGGHPDSVKALLALPSLKALYQGHRNLTSGEAENAPVDFIANPEETGDEAHLITVSVDLNARSFSVVNQRIKTSQTFPIR